MTSTILTILMSVTKWFFERKAAKKLSDADFLAHIEAHQKRRAGVGRQATDFKNNMSDAYKELEAEKKASKK